MVLVQNRLSDSSNANIHDSEENLIRIPTLTAMSPAPVTGLANNSHSTNISCDINQFTQRLLASTLSISLYDYWASAQLAETCPRFSDPKTSNALAGNNFDKQLGFSPAPPKYFQKQTEKETPIAKTERLREVSERQLMQKFPLTFIQSTFIASGQLSLILNS